ncbi:MAG: YaeQ family protein [Bacteriovorax sp.]|nr:YaeQ family protein [Bacteriovorax sp.]
MALKSTIYKAKIAVANLNIHHYQDYNLTVAKHPSETNLRMMYRLVAYALLGHLGPEFTKGLSSDTEPDLWKKNYDGSIDHWIELGHLDERRIRQACSKAREVTLLTYQEALSITWFESVSTFVRRFDHLTIIHLLVKDEQNIEDFVERGMNFTITIEDKDIWLSDESRRIQLEFDVVKKGEV